jgi:hypothetical protein
VTCLVSEASTFKYFIFIETDNTGFGSLFTQLLSPPVKSSPSGAINTLSALSQTRMYVTSRNNNNNKFA